MTNEDITTYLKTNLTLPATPLTNMELLPLSVQKIVRCYAEQPKVRAIMTIGSVPANTSDKHSDIDLVIVCDDSGIPSVDQRLHAVATASDNSAMFNNTDLHIWTFGTSDDFSIDGQEICTQFFTKKYMHDKIDLITQGFYSQIGMEHPLASLSGLLKAVTHIDKDNFYINICKKIDPYPESLRQIIISQELDMRLPYYLNRLETAIERNDIPFADKMIHQAIDSAIYILFAQQRQFPNGPKRLFQQLRSILPKTYADHVETILGKLYQNDLTAESLRQKYTALAALHIFLKTPMQA